MFVQKKIMVIVLLISIIVVSGCAQNTGNDNLTNSSDTTSSISDLDNYSLDSLVIVEQLPDGYEILGILPISNYDTYSENIVDAREGAYRDIDNFDVFLDIIELNSEQAALEFISSYKAQYEPLDTRDNFTTIQFTTIHFNGHDATRITRYRISGGTQLPKYQIIWNNENVVFVVISNSHLESSSLELAKATGH
ncbi:MAG: hypothetical protein P1P80_08435 [ANME-2 cluster archaeon]|nr:hypothetical protein [ANME-2 cluster archaeon]